MSKTRSFHLIQPQAKDLGEGFIVRRALPAPKTRMVGPFIFFDHFGPVEHRPGQGLDVRPHPHIGLSTVTYLFEGAIQHRDMLGHDLVIRPGAVNWMTAGRGICHSERTPDTERRTGQTLHGIQSWVALPKSFAEAAPNFSHHAAETLPSFDVGRTHLTLLAGQGFGRVSPVQFPWPIWYLTGSAGDDTNLLVTADEAEERAVYLVSGQGMLDGTPLQASDMAVLAVGQDAEISFAAGSRFMLLGGKAIDGSRRIDWNFVAKDPARIAKAKADWESSIQGGWQNTPFHLPPGEVEYIPLPD